MSEQQQAVTRLLFELAPRLTRLENALLKGLAEPLTFRQYRLLCRVAEGASTLTDLRTPSILSLAAVSESVDGLVQRKLLARAVDPSDRRAVTISLTERGRQAAAAASRLLDGCGSELVADLGLEDVQWMVDVLGQVRDRVTERLRSLS